MLGFYLYKKSPIKPNITRWAFKACRLIVCREVGQPFLRLPLSLPQRDPFILMYEERFVDVASYVCRILDQIPASPVSPMYVDWRCCCCGGREDQKLSMQRLTPHRSELCGILFLFPLVSRNRGVWIANVAICIHVLYVVQSKTLCLPTPFSVESIKSRHYEQTELTLLDSGDCVWICVVTSKVLTCTVQYVSFYMPPLFPSTFVVDFLTQS